MTVSQWFSREETWLEVADYHDICVSGIDRQSTHNRPEGGFLEKTRVHGLNAYRFWRRDIAGTGTRLWFVCCS
jgi:hypothetical protein